MNASNYGTLEACKKLVEKGIVLETEAGWYKIFRPGCHDFDMVLSARSGNEKFYGDNYPAPSMAEVWRELPEQGCYLTQNQGYNYAWMEWTDFEGHGKSCEAKENINPTDALIDLLIFVKGKKP